MGGVFLGAGDLRATHHACETQTVQTCIISVRHLPLSNSGLSDVDVSKYNCGSAGTRVISMRHAPPAG